MKTQEDVRGLEDKVKGVEQKFKETVNLMLKNMKPFQSELTMITVPKRKKDIVLDGKNCYISQIADGRVIIHFSTMEESDKFYDAWEDAKEKKESWWRKYFKF